jgi:triosephosphate isomerase
MNFTHEKPFIAGNWKMFKTVPEAVDMVQKLHEASLGLEKAQFVVIPSFTALYEVSRALQGSPVQVGAQNRQYFGETNETVNNKIKAALNHGLVPIMCIGESLEERENGNTITKVQSQIIEGLKGLEAEKVRQIIIAYEPIWAIGTGLTATPDQAQEVHRFIRSNLAEKHGNDVASCAIILYGGSVKPENSYSLLKEKDINGALVGGASLKAESFAEIAKKAIKAYEEK